jgi:hypothetical protein
MALPTQIYISESILEDDTDILFMFVTKNKSKLSKEIQIAYEVFFFSKIQNISIIISISLDRSTSLSTKEKHSNHHRR